MIGKEDYDQAITYYREGNYKEAVMWFRKSAEQGFVEAQYHLGAMYLEGRGLVQSDSEAVKWLRKASAPAFLSPKLPPPRIAFPSESTATQAPDPLQAISSGGL